MRAHLDRYAEDGPQGRVFRGPRGGGLRSSTFMARGLTPAVQRLGLSDVQDVAIAGALSEMITQFRSS